MSALAPVSGAVHDRRRPSLPRLLGAVLAGEVIGAMVLWILAMLLTILKLAPVAGAQEWMWLPWNVDGIWALAGALGWGYLVCALIARLVGERIERRGYGRPAAGWLRIAVAVSGYGGMALGRTGDAVLAAVLGGAIVIRLVAFNFDGSLRAWRWRLSDGTQLLVALLAALIALSYSGLHSFVADGSGGTLGTGPNPVRPGHSQLIQVALEHLSLPATITGVSFTGPGDQFLTSSGLVIGGNSSTMLIPNSLRRYAAAHHWSGYVWHATRLPHRVSGGQEIWISQTVKLTSCADVTVNALNLRYRVLGISTSEKIPLQTPLTLICGRP